MRSPLQFDTNAVRSRLRRKPYAHRAASAPRAAGRACSGIWLRRYLAELQAQWLGRSRTIPITFEARDEHFVNWKLDIGGLVDKPMQLSLAELGQMPARTQITRHDCVEGWSCIGKWKGAPLGPILAAGGLKPAARYIAFYCADTLEQTLDGTGQILRERSISSTPSIRRRSSPMK